MFEPKRSSVPQPGLPHTNGTAPAARSGPSAFEASAKAATGTSVIGTDLTILGDRITIISKNKLQVDGDVHAHGKHVVIAEEGSVVGMVSAETIEVHGGVRVGIRAVSVRLQATAQVEGDIAHRLSAGDFLLVSPDEVLREQVAAITPVRCTALKSPKGNL